MAKKTTSHLRGLLSSSVKKACFVLLLIASGVLSMAQSPQYFNLDNGTSSNSFPFNMALGKEVCWLFLAGEFSQPLPIPAGNMITNVYFRISSSGTKDFSNLIILMAQDTISSLTGGTFYSGPMDTVYYNPLATLTGTSGSWMQITLDNPFPYDPSKSLILMVGHCGATGAGLTIYQSGVPGGNRRVWSVAGCPFVAYTSADISSLNFGVDVEPFINIAGVDSVDVLCNGSENGSITITASGGLGPLQYSIDNGATWQSNNAFPGLSPGIYNVIVNDSVGTLTPYAYNPITISEPSAVVISQVNSVNVSCYGENDGSISISATGGTGTLQYSIDGSYSFHSDSIFSDLTAGFYYLGVVDSNGCVVHYSSNPLYISELPNAELFLSVTSCNSYTMNDSVYTSTGIYTQHLLNGNGCDSSIFLDLVINYSSDTTLTETACGTYLFNGHLLDSTDVYYDTIPNSKNCDSVITLNLTIIESSYAGEDSASNICSNITASVDLFDFLAGNYDATGTWNDDDATGQLTGSIFNAAAVVQDSTYHFTYIVSGDLPCPDDSAIISLYVVICEGIDEYSKQNITIFPNPSADFITIIISEKAEIEISNIEGQIIKILTVKDNHTTVDISDLISGIYILKAKTDKSIAIKKFIKE